jgi:AcrR family transcriptional regulator
MRVIAEEVGIRKSSLFHHFSSKESLFDGVFEEILVALSGLLVDLEGEWLDQLDALGSRVVDWLGTHPHASRLLMREIVSSGPVLEGGTALAIHGTLEATSAFLAEGMRQGAIPTADPGHLAVSIIGLHLTWFAAAPVSARVAGGSVFTEDAVAARRAVIHVQVRRLCGVG